jgi:energy-coupling factor transport system ATP-binding protein
VLEKLAREQAVSIIVIEHRLEHLLPLTDRLICMRNGRIVQQITREQLAGGAISSELTAYATAVNSRQKQESLLSDTDGQIPLITVENLRAGYDGQEVFRDISFTLSAGETVALMGDNGCGKTTLVLAMMGIVKPTSGDILFRSKSMTHMKISARARHLGLVFQNPNHQLFESSVVREAALPALFLSENTADKTAQKIDDLLQQFDLLSYSDKNPFTLSLGEKKRLAAVSVLAYSPEILILDEPLVGQDRDRMKRLMDIIRQHRENGGATLMVCHEPSVVAAFCQRILFMENGSLQIDAEVQDAFKAIEAMGRNEYLPGQDLKGKGMEHLHD